MATLETSPAQTELNEQGPKLRAHLDAVNLSHRDTYGALTYADLKATATKLKLPTSNRTKPQLADLLAAHATNKDQARHTLWDLEHQVTEQNNAFTALRTLVKNATKELADLDMCRVRDLALPLTERIEAERYWLERYAVRANSLLGAASHAATFLANYEAAPDGTDPRALAEKTYMKLMVDLVRPGYTRNGPGADAALAAAQEGIKGFLFAIWRILPEAAAHVAMA